jgi:citryl-CoA lyase
MKIKTSITQIKDGKEIIRGKKLEDLVKKYTFAQSIFLLLTGRLPKKNEAKMFDALLISAIDHGPGTASALTARVSASAQNDIHASLAAGILGFGRRHGMATKEAMEFFTIFSLSGKLFQEKSLEVSQVVSDFKTAKLRLAGYGHRVLTKDHRSTTLLSIAKKEKIFGEACRTALAFEKELSKQSSKPLPLNVDGAMAAILCDMGFTPEQGVSVFLVARVPGLLAQICEEVEQDGGLHRLDESEIEFV